MAPTPGSQTSREQTEELVLRALHHHGVTHAGGFRDESFDGLALGAIAEATHLSRPSVYAVRDAYTLNGDSPVLAGDLPGGDGKLKGPLRLRSDLGYAVGVDFGPRHARVAVADVHGQLYDGPGVETDFEVGQAPERYLDWTSHTIQELLPRAGVELADVIGVGISQVAPIDVRSGYPHPNGLTNKAWRDVSVASQLARRLDWVDISTVSDNDTNLRTLAEYENGVGRGAKVVAYINWGNHVGFGLIVNGTVYRGSRGYAGELGHRPIPGGTGHCPRCGRTGCLESTISATVIAAGFGASEIELPRAAEWLLARMADEQATGRSAVFDQLMEATRYLAETVALVVDMLDPEAVILAGSMGAKIHDNTALLGAFRSTLEEHHMGFADNIRLLAPKFGKESAVRGAILRVLSERLIPWARNKIVVSSVASGNDGSPPPRDGRAKRS
ncbi:MAG: ROK family protein [Actinomycetota bacterium]|nr:ROK family protein [Actinomycetota bacterium]